MLLCIACTGIQKERAQCGTAIHFDRFLLQVNLIRSANELPPVAADSFLSEQAALWAEYNSEQMRIVHYDKQGRGPLDRLKSAGFSKRFVSENISSVPASGSVEAILISWKGNKEEENLLNPFYTHMGFGISDFKDGCVVVVLLTE